MLNSEMKTIERDYLRELMAANSFTSNLWSEILLAPARLKASSPVRADNTGSQLYAELVLIRARTLSCSN